MSIDGFAVDLDVVSGIRSLLDSLTEAHLAARDAEDRGLVTAPERPSLVASPVAVVPSWHRDLDRRWLAQHAALLCTHDAAGTALAETVRAYLDVEAALAASATTPRVAGIAPAVLPVPPDTGRDTMVVSGQGGTGSGLGGDCEQVAAGWRRRRDLAADTADRITTAVRRLEGWTGPAAETFTVWAGRNLIDRWHALATAADTINRALLDHPVTPHDEPPDRLPDDGSPPQVPTLTTEPRAFDDTTPATTAAAQRAPASSTAPPVSSVEHSPPPTVPTPSNENAGLVPPPRRPLDPPTVDHAGSSANRLDDDRTDPNSHPSATGTPPPPATATDDTDTTVETTPTSPTPTPDGSPSCAAPAPMAPTTAAAGAMALARADMAHHVIREITIPPTPPGPTPAPGQGTDATLAAPHRPHPPGPTTSPAPDPGPAAPRPTVHPTGVGLPWRTRSRADRHARPAMWVTLHPHTPAGVWVDLAAHRGLGLDGPGAHAVTRTAIAELHTHTATHIIVVRAVMSELLPHGDIGTDASVEGVDPDGAVQVVDDPYDGLQHLADHAHSTRMDCSPCPCLLIAPAPTDPGARDHLAATLDQLPGPTAALLIGLWPGTGLHIDPDHRVRAHRQPRGADLTGRQLHPTEAVDLARLLTPAAPQERTAEAETHDEKTTTSPAERAETPLHLSVLGPVTLTYRPTDTTDRAPDVVVEQIPRLGRELLAYLAAHPHGATRDHLIDTLCPDTTSRRPETTLHSALSRLRRALIDTTTDHDTADVITTGPRWTLNPAVVTVDHWELLATTSITEPTARRAALHRVAGSYTDLYAVDVPGLWAHSIRESTRRRYLQIINELVDIELQHDDSHTALRLLEHARTLEPRNDAIARAIITLQLRADRTSDAQATYELLRTELAAIDAEPEPRTRQLIESASAAGEPRPDRRRR